MALVYRTEAVNIKWLVLCSLPRKQKNLLILEKKGMENICCTKALVKNLAE